MNENKSSDYFDGEEPLLGDIILGLMYGKTEPLLKFLLRGEPISGAAALWIANFLQKGMGKYVFTLELKTKRGAPTTDSSARAFEAALWVYWITNIPESRRKPAKRETAIRIAAKHYHLDPKRVRAEVCYFEEVRMPVEPPHALRRRLAKLTGDVVLQFSLPMALRAMELGLIKQ